MHLRRLPIVAAVSIEEQTLTQQAPATTPPAVNSTGTVPVGECSDRGWQSALVLLSSILYAALKVARMAS